MPVLKCVFCLLIALAASIAAHADSPPQPIPADGKCAVPVDPNWTEQEKFVWVNICIGKAADFNKEPGYGDYRDPRSQTGLPENRILRSAFLETILLKEKYRSALTRLGVRIIGARFTETVDLENAELQHELWLDESLLENGANLPGTETSHRISFDGSKILGTFNAVGAQINKDLSMSRVDFSDVNLIRAHIGTVLDLSGSTVTGMIVLTRAHVGGQLNLRGSTVTGMLQINGIHIDQHLQMHEAKFNEIVLTGAHVGGQLNLSGSTVTGMLNMSGIRVDQDLFMRNEAKFNEIELIGAHIGGDVAISSTVTGILNMSGIRVDQDLFMRNEAKFNEIQLIGAHIGGDVGISSTVTGILNMNGIRVDRSLFMRNEAKFNEIELTAAHIGTVLDLGGSTVTGMLKMYGIHIHQDLQMHEKAKFNEIELTAAHIGGQLNLSGSTVTGMLNMNSIDVHYGLFMKAAQFKDIDLIAARIGGPLELSGSTVTGMLNMNGIGVDQVLMRDEAKFNEIELTAAHIGGQLVLNSSTVTGKLEGNYIDVEQTTYFENATFIDGIDLTSAKLRQDFSLSGGTFNNYMDLTGAQIGGVLNLKSTQWLGSATLNLTGAAVGGIDLSHSWPDKIYLNGLTYRNLSNLAGNFSRTQAKTWFGKQAYAPQPYEQLASVLQSNGLIEDATAIRYAGKEQERREASGLNKAWLVLLNYSIGFGYHLEFAFYWAVFFVVLGWAVLYATGQRTKFGITLGLAYSFDMLLPLVQLQKKHYDIDLDPWPRRYFFAHKIVGVILSSFIVAGITGLTK